MVLMIGGHPRSGTTLLRDVLNGHPQISVTNEFACFAHIGQSWTNCVSTVLERWGNVGGKWAFDARCSSQKDLGKCNLRFCMNYLTHLNKRGPVTVSDIERALQHLFPESRIVGDKWPHYEFMVDELVKVHGVHGLVIYRDCRDVTSSFLRMARTYWRGQAWVNKLNTAATVAAHWVKSIECMELHRDHIDIVRYEEFINSPRTVLSQIADRLRVDAAGFPTAQISHRSIGKFKSGLTADELNDVIAIAGPTMTRLQYT